MSTATPSAPKVVDHVLATILGLDPTQMKNLKDRGVRTWSNLRGEGRIQQYVDDGIIYDCQAQQWRYWIMYQQVYNLSRAAALKMTEDDWDDVDFMRLQSDHDAKKGSMTSAYASTSKSTKTSTAAPPTTTSGAPTKVPSYFGGSVHSTIGTTTGSSPPVTAATCTLTDVQHTTFLKYAKVHLTEEKQISTFYKSLQTQGLSYNIFLRPYEDVAPTAGVVPDNLADDVRIATAVTLYAKLVDSETIPASFKRARQLLSITTDGYVFLQELIRMVHPMLSVKQIASVDIPNFSDTNDIYAYAASIVDWCERHYMKQRRFTYLEVTEIFLDHLDDSRYTIAISTCRHAARHTTPLPVEYQVPTIATTISQMVPETAPTTPTAQTPRHTPRINRIDEHVDAADDDVDSDDTDEIVEPMCCRVWRTDNRRDGRRADGNRPRPGFKGTCKACGLPNHHAADCRFLKKLQQSLAYLEVNPRAADEKKKWKGKHTYQKNRSHVRALQENNFIPYDRAPPDIFLDVVDEDHDVFVPDLLE